MNKILKYTPPGVRIVPQGEYVAASLQQYLEHHDELRQKLSQGGTCKYLTTESTEKFNQSAAMFMHQNVQSEQIELR